MSILGENANQVNQILPHKNKWAWDLFLKGCANNWMPTEISMQKDVEQWKSKNILTDDERLLIKRVLGFFACSESLIGNNILLTIYRYINDGELRQYLTRQMFEEGLHSLTVVYCCDSLNLDVKEIYEAYNTIPIVKQKDDFLIEQTSKIYDKNFDIHSYEGKLEFYKNLFIYYILFEGLLFYNSFTAMLALKRRNIMPGIGQQIEYTLRDECLDRNTELLTPQGWKNITLITTLDKVAQYSLDGNIEFVHPIKLSRTFVDKAISFNNYQNHINLVVSENHRMLKINTKTNTFKVDSASEIKLHPYSAFIMAGNIKGGDKHELSYEERFLIALQADGSIPKGKYRNGNHCGYRQITFYFKKNRKIERFKEILSNLPWKFSTKKNKQGILFTVNTPLRYCHKTFDKWVNLNAISKSWCVDFIEEISKWDGHIVSNSDRITYGSVIKSNVDIIQAIACLANYRTHVTVRPDKRKSTFSDYWRLQICKNRNSIKTRAIEKTFINNFNDFVYGVEVPSSYILVRRNNAVCITGNCLHVTFGTTLIKQLQNEQNILQYNDVLPLLNKAIELEKGYVDGAIPHGILGFDKTLSHQYIQHLANRRFADLGFKQPFKNVENPFSWLSENIDLPKMKNFFESRVIEYQTSKMEDDL